MTPTEILKAALSASDYKALPRSANARKLIVDLACGQTVRPITPISKGYSDASQGLAVAVRLMGKTVEGNDAPKGGKTGYWAKLTPEALNSETAQAIRKAKAEFEQVADLLTQWAKQAKENALMRAVQDHAETLLAWRESGYLHPAPFAVIEAKFQSGLSWRQLKDATAVLAFSQTQPPQQ